jgi:hypothetical protein
LRLLPPGSLAVACRSTTGFSKSSPEPELLELLDTTLEDAWYPLEEMIIWARTFDDRRRHPAHDRRTYPDQN